MNSLLVAVAIILIAIIVGLAVFYTDPRAPIIALAAIVAYVLFRMFKKDKEA